MADVNAVISLGIGTPGGIPVFLTFGLQSGSPSTFIGPAITPFYLVEDVAMASRNYAARFTGDTLTFTINGTLPTGVTLSSAGVLSGTPTTAGTSAGLSITAEDADTNTADSNEFSITVGAAQATQSRRPARPGGMMVR